MSTTLLLAAAAAGFTSAPAFLDANDAAHDLGFATLADCTAPDGSTFTTEIVSLPNGTVRFLQTHADGRAALLVVTTEEGERAHARDESSGEWRTASEGTASFAHGHDVHRLFLDARAKSADDRGPVRLTRQSPPAFGGGEVEIEFRETRELLGLELPFAVAFTRAGETYEYAFREVLPFRWAPGVELPTDPATLFARLDDARALVASHERVMQAHRDGDVEAIVAEQSERGIVSGRGTLSDNDIETTRERLGPYLSSTRFSYYADVVPPVVAVSADGTLGWLACEMEAVGIQDLGGGRADQVVFGYTWVELYARSEGRWLRTGNASSGR